MQTGMKKKEVSKILVDYIKGLRDENESDELLAKIDGCVNRQMSNVLAYKRMPRYAEVMNLMTYYCAPIQDLLDIAQKDPVVKFDYWNELYPEEDIRENFRFYIREVLQESGMTLLDLSKKSGVTAPYISSVLSGRYEVTYYLIQTFSKTLGMTEDEFLDGYRGRKGIAQKRKLLARRIAETREDLGYTVSQAAELLGITETRYLKIEESSDVIMGKSLLRLCKLFRIDAKEIGKMALDAHLVVDGDVIEDIIKNDKFVPQYMEGKFFAPKEIIKEVLAYEKVSIKQDVCLTRNLLTCIILFLHNDKEQYRGEIMQYLKNLTKDRPYKKLMMFKAKEDMKTMSDVFSVYKKELGYSFLEISKISGISKGYISNRNQSDDFDVAFMNKVFPVLNIPLSCGIEMYLEKISQNSKKKKREVLNGRRVLLKMKEKRYVCYDNRLIPTKTIEIMVNNIFDGELSTIDKYNLNQIELKKTKNK